VSHVGTVLLAEVADRFGLTAAFSEVMDTTRRRSGGHDPGRVLVDLAVAIADGAETITDLRVLSDQELLHGPVASTATAWRVLDSVDASRLSALRAARAVARERAWLARGELTGQALPQSRAAGRDLPGLVIDVDASLVEAHSDKEGASGNFKGGFGYHPLLAFLDNTNEALAGILRPGRAGSNTAADHIELLDLAVAQIPDAWRDKPILVRSDGAGFSHALLTYLADRFGYSVGWPVIETVRTAIDTPPKRSWSPAIETDGELREGADVAEATGLLDLSAWPSGMRIIVRRERPHPGAQLSLFEHRDGYRYQTFVTNTGHGRGGLAFLEARHRAHARVEDRIRCAKDTGMGRLPSREMAIQCRLARTGPRRHGPHRLAANQPPHRPPDTGQSGAENVAVQAVTHRSPDHPRWSANLPQPRPILALGHRDSRCLRPPATHTGPRIARWPRPDEQDRGPRPHAGRPRTPPSETHPHDTKK
jgi:hypothetical protein